MIETAPPLSDGRPLDGGLRALCGIAAYYRIGADPVQLARELALGPRQSSPMWRKLILARILSSLGEPANR